MSYGLPNGYQPSSIVQNHEPNNNNTLNSSSDADQQQFNQSNSTFTRRTFRDKTEQSDLLYHRIVRECQQNRVLYEDPEFVPSYKLLIRRFPYPIVWLRPHEIVPSPKFSNLKWNRPIEVGLIGDYNLVIALTALTTMPKLLHRVVPNQNFDNYCGVFRFRFWHFGNWQEISIDDRLPTYRKRPIGLNSCYESDHNNYDFWPALLEKAYAKFYGGYDKLSSNFTENAGSDFGIGSGVSRALSDLTGGIVQSFNLIDQDRYLTYQILNSAVPRSTLIVATILQKDETKKSFIRQNHGLICNGSYEITGLARIRDNSNSIITANSINSKLGSGGETPLVRLSGPFKKGAWIGPWSLGSFEMESLPLRDKEVLNVRTRGEDGEFWMSFLDFTRIFTNLDLVHIGPDDWLIETAIQPRKPWRSVLAKRRWRKGYNSGGSPQYRETTSMNPQFVIQIPRTSEELNTSTSSTSGSKCHVVVSVAQQYFTSSTSPLKLQLDSRGRYIGESRKKKKKDGSSVQNLHAIGFAIYEVPASMSVSRINQQFITDTVPLDVTQHMRVREVATFFALPPGEYIIVPQTLRPHLEAKFLLRILTDEQSKIWELNEDNIIYKNISFENFETNFNMNEYSKLLKRWTSNHRVLNDDFEIDAFGLRKLLKRNWKTWFYSSKPSLELCKSIIMLRDTNISGRLSIHKDLLPILNLLILWKIAFIKTLKSSRGQQKEYISSYLIRNLLFECGIRLSNKVCECLILRFSNNVSTIHYNDFVHAILKIHLAHERFQSLDTKTKITLEEMILLTIYS